MKIKLIKGLSYQNMEGFKAVKDVPVTVEAAKGKALIATGFFAEVTAEKSDAPKDGDDAKEPEKSDAPKDKKQQKKAAEGSKTMEDLLKE